MAMTEKEWLACNDPQRMLEFLREKASERKLRLFAVGCCRPLDREHWNADSFVAFLLTSPHAFYAAEGAITAVDHLGWEWYEEGKEREHGQTAMLRHIFGNPFRPVTINPAWRTSNVTGLAQSIYDKGAFDCLPILADALEDAGCDNQDVLNHCRQPGEHVRGCWVVDLVLGKE
jgi:hypothetical protein